MCSRIGSREKIYGNQKIDVFSHTWALAFDTQVPLDNDNSVAALQGVMFGDQTRAKVDK